MVQHMTGQNIAIDQKELTPHLNKIKAKEEDLMKLGIGYVSPLVINPFMLTSIFYLYFLRNNKQASAYKLIKKMGALRLLQGFSQ